MKRPCWPDGAREGAADMAEQLAGEQALGERAAADGHERPRLPRGGEPARNDPLPVPVSPVMTTVRLCGATASMLAGWPRSRGLCP